MRCSPKENLNRRYAKNCPHAVISYVSYVKLLNLLFAQHIADSIHQFIFKIPFAECH